MMLCFQLFYQLYSILSQYINVSVIFLMLYNVFMYLCICVFVYLCICVFVYLCICVFVYLCIYYNRLEFRVHVHLFVALICN